MKTRLRAFTLIELLIVVAIIAILAAIAVPNFLEAQMRAKLTSVHQDFRVVRFAMEAYKLDNNDYPKDDQGTSWWNDYLPLIALTTPIAYMNQVPVNPFFDNRADHPNNRLMRGNYAYWRDYAADWGYDEAQYGIFYSLTSVGPDRVGGLNPLAKNIKERNPDFLNHLYNPTNGTKSYGDLHMCNQGTSE